MNRNFHELFSQGEVNPPSERATGLVFAAVATIVAVAWRDSPTVMWVAATIAALLLAASFLSPSLLRPLNLVWFQIGMLLHRIVNPLVMFVIFAVIFVPAGLLMRIWYDPLRSKRSNGTTTYWIDREGCGPAVGSMTNQF